MTCPTEQAPRHVGLPAAAWSCLVGVALLGCGSTDGGGVPQGGGGGVVDVEDCPVAELIADVAAVEGLVADGAGAFWMDGGRVFHVDDVDRVPRLLGDVGRELSTATGNRLTASEAHVYASGALGIVRMSKGGATAPEVLSAPLERVHALAVTSEWLFVGRMDWASDSGSLLRIPLTGGEPEMLLADGWVYDLEVDGEQVYWSDSGTFSGPAGQQVDDENGRIGRSGPGGTEVLHQGLVGSPMGMALDAVSLYWADYHGGAVVGTPKAGGPVGVVAEVMVPRDVVVAAEGTYVTRDLTNDISIVPPGSGELQCFASLPAGARGDPAQIALSSEFVYVLTVERGESLGAIVRARRRLAE